jgi:phage transcriptional regulator (fragment)
METLLKIWETDRGNQSVNARDLYNFLENKSGFSHWINNRIKKYGFEENKDYYKLYFDIYGNEVDIEDYISGRIDYYVTSDMAKQLIIVERKKKGTEFTKSMIERDNNSTKILGKFTELEYNLNSDKLFLKDNKVFISELNLSNLVKEPINSKLEDPMFKDLLKEGNHIQKDDEENRILDELATILLLKDYPFNILYKYLKEYLTLKDSLIDIYKLNVIDNILPEYKGERRYVYIIQNTVTKNIKIGVATNPSDRLSQLQTGSDVDLKLIYTSGVCSNSFEIESTCHNHFKESHVRGEWFKVEPSEAISFLESQKFVLTSNILG